MPGNGPKISRQNNKSRVSNNQHRRPHVYLRRLFSHRVHVSFDTIVAAYDTPWYGGQIRLSEHDSSKLIGDHWADYNSRKLQFCLLGDHKMDSSSSLLLSQQVVMQSYRAISVDQAVTKAYLKGAHQRGDEISILGDVGQSGRRVGILGDISQWAREASTVVTARRRGGESGLSGSVNWPLRLIQGGSQGSAPRACSYFSLFFVVLPWLIWD